MFWKLLEVWTLFQRQASMQAFPLLVRSCVAACESLSRSVPRFPPQENGKDQRTCPLMSALQGRLALRRRWRRGLSGLLADRMAVVLLIDLHSFIRSLTVISRGLHLLSLLLTAAAYSSRSQMQTSKDILLTVDSILSRTPGFSRNRWRKVTSRGNAAHYPREAWRWVEAPVKPDWATGGSGTWLRRRGSGTSAPSAARKIQPQAWSRRRQVGGARGCLGFPQRPRGVRTSPPTRPRKRASPHATDTLTESRQLAPTSVSPPRRKALALSVRGWSGCTSWYTWLCFSCRHSGARPRWPASRCCW